jgi:low temperature requirement protein LtrA
LQFAGSAQPIGAFYGLCLTGGVILHLIGHLVFDRRVLRPRNVARISALLVLAALALGIIAVPALVALACVTLVLGALVVFERVHFAELRRQYRSA